MSESMRAVVITEFGEPEVLEVQDVPRPEPGASEVRVRVSTSGINRADLLQRVGRYPVPAGWPEDIPGLEFAGVVEAVGPGVASVSEGDPVMGILGGGGYAEYVVTHEHTLVPIPSTLNVEDAGAVPEAFMTAFDAVFLQEKLQAGETLLIHAVGSGVGTAALQMAVAAGARVIGTSRTPEKLERARELGLSDAVLADEGWPDSVMELTDGKGADVILDLVGGPYLEGNQKVLGMLGRHVVVGVPAGPVAEINLRTLMGRRASIRGTVLRARPLIEKTGLARAFSEWVCPLFEEGRARPVVDRILAPEEAPEAHRHVAENRTFGKVLLKW